MLLFILSVLIVVLDQVSKLAAIRHLKGNVPYVIIENFFQLNYVENFGAAFGILQHKKILFIIITSLVVICISLFLIRNQHALNRFMKVALGMLLGGAIGNLIDRIRLGYVVDFISVKLINKYDFPVFNVADVFIVVGTVLIVILVSFDRYEA
ncbi:signal peptidase II [Tissierella sp. MSJ-40]|uniref:Lipoprotein signal peptidase n=1 Tax=Tissierella simiarum TaxID=2841534 RepID=A0ABS6EBP5_9FIRM|nr:signal peptidase II [Tissierella simiarum]